jgi:hypothetical protein
MNTITYHFFIRAPISPLQFFQSIKFIKIIGGAMDLLTHVITFLIGLGAGWSLKVFISNTSSTSKKTAVVLQNRNNAGGDIVAGDKSNVSKH